MTLSFAILNKNIQHIDTKRNGIHNINTFMMKDSITSVSLPTLSIMLLSFTALYIATLNRMTYSMMYLL